MPILDPQLLLALLENKDPTNINNESFLLYLLENAANHLNTNIDTLESTIQFKQDLKTAKFNTKNKFKLDLSIKDDIDNPLIDNIYQHIYDKIDLKYKAERIRTGFPGSYYTYNSDLNFFMPNIENNDSRLWYLTDTSIAIICIKPNKSHTNITDILYSFLLEMDLMISSGFSVVLCIMFSKNNSNLSEKAYLDMLKKHHLIEVHLFFDLEINESSESFEYFFKSLDDCSDELESFFYVYSRYFDDSSQKVIDLLKSLNEKLYFNVFNFSKSPREAIKTDIDLKISEKFIFNKFNKESNFIFVRLNNIPLFETDNEQEDFVPSRVSGFTTVYMSPQDFKNLNSFRVKILFNDEINNTDIIYQYANFDDLHSIKIEFYVKETLYLTKTAEETLNSVDNIIQKLAERIENNEEFKKESAIFTFIKDKKIQKFFSYVTFAYTLFQRKRNPSFFLYKAQVFTAYEACKIFLDDTKKLNDEKSGFIYQVETGEGKSCIVCLIASLLALMKKTVHITSSNISLANRDYHESFQFFQQLGLKSAVLLHYNELPVNLSTKKHEVKNTNINDTNFVYNVDFYPEEFFKKSLFKNSSNMNFSVCGIGEDNKPSSGKANVVFSTFVNFECLYLKLMETCPGYVSEFFKDCSLVIDEADSILIDELTNGTILSRSIKTNGKEVLKFVYKNRIENKSEEETFNELIAEFPKCKDMRIEDVKDMYSQIDLVNQEEFQDGKKYSIETIEKKEKLTLQSLINESKDFIKETKDKIKDKIKRKEKKHRKKDDDKSSKHSKRIKKTYKQIVPFDYDHKGVLEPNKEFSGFVQQFIAIKEMFNNKENENMLIKEVSMNYLYVSHPIFVSLYSAVCGLTGTIGNSFDKNIFNDQYHLLTKVIPRESPNQRIEYPIILCDGIKERNIKIASEIIKLNEKKIPVLVIFQDLKEISMLYKLLSSKGIKSINIFDGKNEKIKPDQIVGLDGAVSLGTNVCGRGTDVKNMGKPLHIIVTYFSSNTRVMDQAFGRTARQGKKGSVRIICLESQFIAPIRLFNDIEMQNILEDFQFKNDLQRSFIDKFREKRKWIFEGHIESQKLSEQDIITMRETRINVNRIKVFNFEFPICMSISTFLLIQAQKIFSLYNCPNCKYTWLLFQKYIREMILESWSLFIEKSEKKYFENKIKAKFSDFLQAEYKNLCSLLKIYLPENSNNPIDYEIIPTFMHIFNFVRDYYEIKILKTFPDELTSCLKQNGIKTYCSFTIGFKPYTLVDESGARINVIDSGEQQQTFIQDPELKYYREQPHHHLSILSITEKIDGIFNMICQKINDIIGSYIGLRFFLRRTLGGCEFGLCYDFNIENIDDSILRDQNCLVDKDPLFLFTINVKSMVPILAGILIIGLVYIASISKSIFEWISTFGTKTLIDLATKTVKEVVKRVVKGQIDNFCSSICIFLQKQIIQQIVKIKLNNEKMAKLFTLLLKIASPKDFSQSGDMVNKLFAGKISMSMSFTDDLIDEIPTHHFLKIGFLLMLCFASFMVNFNYNKEIKYDSKKVAAEYDMEQNTQEALENNQYIVHDETID